jgi:hypothetical protein
MPMPFVSAWNFVSCKRASEFSKKKADVRKWTIRRRSSISEKGDREKVNFEFVDRI